MRHPIRDEYLADWCDVPVNGLCRVWLVSDKTYNILITDGGQIMHIYYLEIYQIPATCSLLDRLARNRIFIMYFPIIS